MANGTTARTLDRRDGTRAVAAGLAAAALLMGGYLWGHSETHRPRAAAFHERGPDGPAPLVNGSELVTANVESIAAAPADLFPAQTPAAGAPATDGRTGRGAGIAVAARVSPAPSADRSAAARPQASGLSPQASAVIPFRVTAYCPCEVCCGAHADGVTASGAPARGKLIAAPKSIPFGTVIEVPGYGRAEVLDRGVAITEGRLDVLFATHAEALAWGVRHLDCRVFRREAPDAGDGEGRIP